MPFRSLPEEDIKWLDARAAELRELTQWCEGMVWCSPERHGAVTGIIKSQIDWLPLNVGAVRPTQGKTLAGKPVDRNVVVAAVLTRLLPALEEFDREGLAPFLPRAT